MIENEKALCETNEIIFTENWPAGMGVRTDPKQLLHAITNLVRNTRPSIEVSTKTGVISLKAGETDKYWVVDVTDNGPGLPEQTRARVGGAGLRDAISQEVIRRHGGKIELLKSNKNGTRFLTLSPKRPLRDPKIKRSSISPVEFPLHLRVPCRRRLVMHR